MCNIVTFTDNLVYVTQSCVHSTVLDTSIQGKSWFMCIYIYIERETHTPRMSHMCDTPEYMDRSLGSFVYRGTARMPNLCDTSKYTVRG
jgi:hypothetical protein